MSTTSTDGSTMLTQQHHSMPHSQSITGVAEFDGQTVVSAKNVSPPSPFASHYINLLSARDGARVLFATDEWFATADRLLCDEAPQFDPDAFCEQGKVMDGWETRRRREAGHDWSVIQLATRGNILGIEIDTAHFTGNHVPALSLQVADLSCEQERDMARHLPGIVDRLLLGGVQGTGATPLEVQQAEQAVSTVQWHTLLGQTVLRPGYENSRLHYFTLETPSKLATHVRVNYYPDGGVARLRLWGTISATLPVPLVPGPAYSPIKTGRTCTVVPHRYDNNDHLPSAQFYEHAELSSAERGGQGVACSNQHYGHPDNLVQAAYGRDMGDGWETARHPSRPSVLVRDPNTGLVDSPLSDWCVLQLGTLATDGVSRVILDTKHFRGNYPESVLVQGGYCADEEDFDNVEWFTLVPRGRMAPDAEHVFDCHQLVNADRAVTHVKVSIFPDGGLSRVRVYSAATMGEAQ